MKAFAVACQTLPWIALSFVSAHSVPLPSSAIGARDARIASVAQQATDASLFYIPRGKPIKVDGEVGIDEWSDAATTQIKVSSTWKSTVKFKRDDQFLYFLFTEVKHRSERLYPEILIDPMLRRTAGWEKGQWWFHVSGNLCEGDGEPNVYNRNGVFQCSRQKPGWDGNNPPGPKTDAIEIKISFAKIGLDPHADRRFGLALGLTNATGDAKQKWYFSPSSAALDRPATWGVAVLK